MSIRKNKSISLWGQGGVALADILANSVAVILILIVVTLSVQQEKADLELEKNADVTTLLARQIATTVVYNDLPSSKPAVLHDYHSCRIPHDCNPSLYPIIELRQNFIREYNSNLRFYRKELLAPNNPFDQLIRTFNPQEKLNIRIDVYDVNLYYLAIGILKEHNISPRHWHYLGEDVKPLVSPEKALADGKHGAADQEQEKTGDGDELHADGTENSGSDGEQEGDNNNHSLDNTQLADLNTLQEIQHDSLLPPNADEPNANDNSNQEANPQGGESQQSEDSSAESEITPETMFESMIELLQNDGSLGQGTSSNQNNGQGRRSLKMHVPNSQSSNQGSQEPKEKVTLNAEDYNRVLLAFFLDQLLLARAQKTSFIQGLNLIIQRYAQDPSMIQNHPQAELINDLDGQLKKFFVNKATQPAPMMKIITGAPNALHLSANHVNATSTVLVDQADALWSESITTDNTTINLILRAFPGLYKGQTLDFPPGHLLLVHPNEADRPEMQWRPVIIVDTWLEDASLGFVKGAFNNNTLTLDAQTLGTKLNNTLIPEPPLQENPNTKYITAILYWSVGLILFMLLILGLSIVFIMRKRRISSSSIPNNMTKNSLTEIRE